MVTAEERMRILEMLHEGKLTPEAASQLLQALGEGDPDAAALGMQEPLPEQPFGTPEAAFNQEAPSGRKPRWLRVRVTDVDTGRPRVNVRVPVGLINLGIKLGQQFVPEIEGLDIGMLAKAIEDSETGAFVDVIDEEDGEHVEVFLE